MLQFKGIEGVSAMIATPVEGVGIMDTRLLSVTIRT